MMLKGIDVSEHQGAINWSQAKASGVQFTMIRGGYGRNNVDKYFHANAKGATAAGIPIGMYWFSYAYTVDMARNGRFVHRSGRGRSAGYAPYLHMMEDGMDDYDMYDGMSYPMTGYRMGYTDGNRGGNMGNSSSSGSYSGNYGGGNSRSGYEGMRQPSRYGESYDRYKDSRRHYTENPTPEHQQKMKDDADDVFDDIEELAKKMYSEADANDKAKFKQKMTQLVQNMK